MKNIKCQVVFVMAMMLAAVNARAQTTISKVFIRDCSRQGDTSTAVTSGSTVNPAKLPTSWTLDFVLTRNADVVFSTDGGIENEFESTPYCPIGHNTPLKFAAGTHKITVQINSATPITFTIIIGSPSAVADTEDPCVFGSNGEGVTYPSGDPSLHPQLLTACRAYDFEYFRLWTEEPFSTPFPSSYWKIPLKYQAAGIKVMAVINFQNSPNSAAPSDKDWLTKINSFPNARTAGVWGVCLGNECDSKSYYTGTYSQLAHLMQLAYPILQDKGYVVIGPSAISSLALLEHLNALGALRYCDYADYHVYATTAQAALSVVDGYKSYCKSIDKPSLMSELGIRGLGTNTSGWSKQCQLLFAGLQSRSGIYLQFPLFWLTSSTDPLCQQAPLSRTYGSNGPFTLVWDSLSN
jgi:hypothetical protein